VFLAARFSSAIAAHRSVLHHRSPSPRAWHPPAATFSSVGAPCRKRAHLPGQRYGLHYGCRTPGAPPLTGGRVATSPLPSSSTAPSARVSLYSATPAHLPGFAKSAY
jgi:hypothetical protein